MKNRFVVLYHQMSGGHERASHFDWMFELDGSLQTWAVENNNEIGDFLSSPSRSKAFCWPAIKLTNHRIQYLDYEGPVSNNRGNVKRRLKGEFELIRNNQDAFQVSLQLGQASDVESIQTCFVRNDTHWRLMIENPAMAETDD